MNNSEIEQLQQEVERLKAENDYLKIKVASSVIRSNDSALWEIASHVPVGIIWRQGDNLVANFFVEALTGYQNADFAVPDRWFELLFAERAKEERARYNYAREAGFPSPYEITFTSKSGKRVVAEFTGRQLSAGEVWSLVDITQRKEAEQALQASEARHEAALDALPDPIYMVNINGDFLDYHAPEGTVLFASPSEFLGRNAREFLPGWLVDEAQHWCRLAIETKQVQVWEFYHDAVDWEARALTYKEDSVLIMLRDVTTRKLAERKLQESEHRYKTLIELLPDGLYIAKQGAILFTNPALARILGYDSPEELVGMSLYDILHTDDHELVKTRKAALDSDSKPLYQRERYLRRDGTSVIVDAIGVLTELDGETVGLVVLRDMTERIAAQELLTYGQNLFVAFMESFPALVWMKDEEGRMVYANRRWQDRLEAKEWLGKTVQEIYEPRFAEQTDALDQLALQQEEPFQQILREERPSETKVWDVYKFRLKGKESGYSLGGFAIDITERTRLEEQLRQALKMESIGRLAGGIAHDFNNLLTVIIGYSDMLADSLPEADRRRNGAQQILMAANRAAGLTRQLLAFARKQMIEPRLLDPHELLRSLAPLLERLIGEHIPIQLSLSPNVGSITVDAGQLEQVIINLAANARDAMPDGGRLVIETQKETLTEEFTRHIGEIQPGEYVRISVSDSGTGIPPEVLENIFEPFFTTKEIGKGTGLGLATCHGIIKQAGGHISVYSEAGRGTTFHIYLRETAERMPAPAPAPRMQTLPMGRGNILLVEDEELIRNMAREILERQGYQVQSYENGLEALMGLESLREPIDLVITDVVMPQMNGRELAERLMALRGATLKVLYISGYTESEVVYHGVLEEGIEFLPKPFTPSALIQKVRGILKGEDDMNRPYEV